MTMDAGTIASSGPPSRDGSWRRATPTTTRLGASGTG